jgi:hypothetical protein
MKNIEEIIIQLDQYMELNSKDLILIPEASNFLFEKSLLSSKTLTPAKSLEKLLIERAILNSFQYGELWVIFHRKSWEKIKNQPLYSEISPDSNLKNLWWYEKLFSKEAQKKPIDYYLPNNLNYRLIRSEETGLIEFALIITHETTKKQIGDSWEDILDVRDNLEKLQGLDLEDDNGYAKYYLHFLHYQNGESYRQIAKILNYDILASLVHFLSLKKGEISQDIVFKMGGYIPLLNWFYEYILQTGDLPGWQEIQLNLIDEKILPVTLEDDPIENTKIRDIIRHNKKRFSSFKYRFFGRENIIIGQRKILLETGSYDNANLLLKKLAPGQWQKYQRWIIKRIEKIKEETMA